MPVKQTREKLPPNALRNALLAFERDGWPESVNDVGGLRSLAKQIGTTHNALQRTLHDLRAEGLVTLPRWSERLSDDVGLRRACLECKALFKPLNQNQVYCSEQCRWTRRYRDQRRKAGLPAYTVRQPKAAARPSKARGDGHPIERPHVSGDGEQTTGGTAERTPRPPGRPPAAGEPRAVRLEVRVTQSEHAAILAAGGSEWVRGLVKKALERLAAHSAQGG